MSIQDFQKKNPTFVIRVIFTINIFWVVLPKIISKFLGILCPMQSLSVISNSSTRLRQAPRKILRVVEQEISPKGRNDNEGVEMTAGKPEFSINDIGNDRFFSNWGQAWVLSFDKAQDRLRDLRSRLIRCRGGVHLKGRARARMVLGPFVETKERVLSQRRRNLVARGRNPAYTNFILTAR